MGAWRPAGEGKGLPKSTAKSRGRLQREEPGWGGSSHVPAGCAKCRSSTPGVLPCVCLFGLADVKHIHRLAASGPMYRAHVRFLTNIRNRAGEKEAKIGEYEQVAQFFSSFIHVANECQRHARHWGHQKTQFLGNSKTGKGNRDEERDHLQSKVTGPGSRPSLCLIWSFPGLEPDPGFLVSNPTFLGLIIHPWSRLGIPSSPRIPSQLGLPSASSSPLFAGLFSLFSATSYLALKVRLNHLLGQLSRTMLCVLSAFPDGWRFSTSPFIVHLPISPVACEPLEQRRTLSTSLFWQLIDAWHRNTLNKCLSK